MKVFVLVALLAAVACVHGKTWRSGDCAVISASALNVRDSQCGAVVDSLGNGAHVNISSVDGVKTCLGGTYNWVRIAYGGNNRYSGHVADDYLTKVTCPEAGATTTTHHINQAGLELIEVSEGWESCYYLDVAGYGTIGYGHLVTSSDPYGPGSCISKAEGEQLLLQDVKSAEDCVNKYVKVPLNDNQFSALVDFTFNLGCGAFRDSTLLSKLNQGDYQSVCSELQRWVYAGGVVQPGLVTRRQRECDLFNS
eukprot:TRINITY_DN26640_c0_g1_i1.p1 TRINITY_DN26640_c0_g1~~TRINITY_DN26640_c0_g1_i1.p1  ORF type:complete len:278 (-),score=47.07 TRINITY_DN26640_c0_g1_i1:116-871(-)